MKPLNTADIATAYFRFLGHFLVLMLSVIFLIWAFLKSFTEQTQLLRNYRDQYSRVLFMQGRMEQKTDSIYADLRALNTAPAGSQRLREQRVLHEQDELDKLLKQRYRNAQPHEAYRRITGCVNELLVLKDSIHNVDMRLQDVRRDLRYCQRTGLRPK